MKLSIIILSFNTKDLTIECINSIADLYREELKNNNDFEIILVDNNSNDGTVDAISKLKSQNLNLTVVQNKQNLGFSKGCNLGAKHAKGEYLLFLNSDTQVKDKGFLKMLDFLQNDPKVGILGGRMLNSDGAIQSSSGRFYNLFNLLLVLLGGERLGLIRQAPEKIQRVDFVSGGCMMVKKTTFQKIGGFEEKLFMYMEDMELCYRAKTMGFLSFYFPEVNVIHKERGSSNKTFAVINIYKGILFFYSKYKPGWQYKTARFLLLAKSFILTNTGRLMGNKYLVETYAKTLELF